MDSCAAIEDDETGAPDAVEFATPRSWYADNEKCESALRSAWFDCRCQSWFAPALIPNGTGPCPGLNAPPPTLDPPSEPGEPEGGSACMRE